MERVNNHQSISSPTAILDRGRDDECHDTDDKRRIRKSYRLTRYTVDLVKLLGAKMQLSDTAVIEFAVIRMAANQVKESGQCKALRQLDTREQKFYHYAQWQLAATAL